MARINGTSFGHAHELRHRALGCLLCWATGVVSPPDKAPNDMRFRPFRAVCTIAAPVLLAITAAPRQLDSQSTPFVNPAEPVYHVVDRLVWEGLVDTVLVGQKPYSRLAIARIVAEADRNRGRLERRIAEAPEGSGERRALDRRLERVDQLLSALRSEYARELDALSGDRGRSWGVLAAFDHASEDAVWLDSPPQIVPSSVGLGGIDAVTNPLVDGERGEAFGQRTFRVSGAAHAQLGRWAALSAAGSVAAFRDEENDTRDRSRIDVLAASTALGNLRVDVGRDYVQWGQALDGGLAVSANAPPLDMVRLSSDRPFRFPWILRALGPSRATVFVADLGGAREFPHAKLVGYQISILPHPRLELGVTVLDETGGSGAPKATFGDRVQDVLPLIDVLFRGGSDFQFSNKLSGAELRYRVPGARGLELHVQSMLDDFDVRRLKSVLWEDNGVIAGFVLPRLTADGRFRLAGEAHHTGVRYYEHNQFSSGITLRNSIIGDALGPRGDAGYLRLGWEPTLELSFELRGALERRSADQYQYVSSGPNDEGFGFAKTVDLPDESRERLTLAMSRGLPLRGSRLVAEAGVERVANAGYSADRSRTNLMLRLRAEVRR